MKLCMPEYYKKFKCTAEKCSDNCCIGWEIDIDDVTFSKYNKINSDFGKKLNENICKGKQKSFILDNNERCPFLNNENLCEIFIKLGENNLCKICTEHPRYYEWFDGIKEGGIGLCCEEAARIILSENKKFSTYTIDIPTEDCDEYDNSIYLYIKNARNKIIDYLDNCSLPLELKIRNILLFSEELQNNIDTNNLKPVNFTFKEEVLNVLHNKEPIFDFFLTLESLDNNWIPYLKDCISTYNTYKYRVQDFKKYSYELPHYLKNISIYFIWRYFLKGVFDSDVLSKAKLFVVSILMLETLFFNKWLETGTLSLNDCVSIVKNYSKEIEYSEENLLTLKKAFNTLDIFSVKNLSNFFT